MKGYWRGKTIIMSGIATILFSIITAVLIYYFVIFLLLAALFMFSGAQIYIKYLKKSLESEKAFW